MDFTFRAINAFTFMRRTVASLPYTSRPTQSMIVVSPRERVVRRRSIRFFESERSATDRTKGAPDIIVRINGPLRVPRRPFAGYLVADCHPTTPTNPSCDHAVLYAQEVPLPRRDTHCMGRFTEGPDLGPGGTRKMGGHNAVRAQSVDLLGYFREKSGKPKAAD
jgi:hypothetical protein